MRISRRFTMLLMGIFMGIFMSFFMSLVISFINVGLVPDFLFIWMRAWAAGFIISVPIAVMVFPIVKKVVDRLVGGQN